MERYAEYKDSQIDWIGEIPAHWFIQRGKTILTLLNRPIRVSDEVITCFRDGEVTLRKKRREDGFTISLQESGYQGIEPGDLVVHGMDGFAGAIGVSDSRGKATPVLNVMDSKQNKRYLMYYLRMAAIKDVFMSLSTGIRVRSCDLRWNKLSIFPFTLPPIKEQNSIVEYIDHKVTTIDALISEACASIEEYKAWKASIIYEAVTKGLDKDVEMKDSGVEWIGEIPVHWHCIKARRIILSTQNGITRRDLEKSEGQIVLKLKNITPDGTIDYFEPNRIELSEIERKTYQLKQGDLLFVRVNGSRHLVGKCALFTGFGEIVAFNDHIIRTRINEMYEARFFQYYLLSPAGKCEIELHTSTSAGQYTISGEGLRDINLTFPSKSEQKTIVSYLDKHCGKIDSIISEKESLIADLESYKKSLIFEVVTGKRKVV